MSTHSQSNLHLAVRYLQDEHLQSYYRLTMWAYKGSLGAHLSVLRSSLKTAAHGKATVATVTVQQGCRESSVGWELLFSRSSSSVNEELAGSRLSTTGTRCF